MEGDLTFFPHAPVCNILKFHKLVAPFKFFMMLGFTIKPFTVFHIVYLELLVEIYEDGQSFGKYSFWSVRVDAFVLVQVLSRFPLLRHQQHQFLRTLTQANVGEHLYNFTVSSYDNRSGLFGYLIEVGEPFRLRNVRITLKYLSTVSRKQFLSDIADLCYICHFIKQYFLRVRAKTSFVVSKKCVYLPELRAFFYSYMR